LRDLDLRFPPGTNVWVDTSYIEGLDHRYAIGAVRHRLLALGAQLVPTRAEADVVVELRAGALSIDKEGTLLGIPSLPVPVPLVGVMEAPQLPILKRASQTGVPKLGITAYDAKTGRWTPSSPTDPAYGFSKHT